MILDGTSNVSKTNLEKCDKCNTWKDNIKLILAGGPGSIITLLIMFMVFSVIIMMCGGWMNFIIYEIKQYCEINDHAGTFNTCIGSLWR
jgi:hypothetical protein